MMTIDNQTTNILLGLLGLLVFFLLLRRFGTPASAKRSFNRVTGQKIKQALREGKTPVVVELAPGEKIYVVVSEIEPPQGPSNEPLQYDQMTPAQKQQYGFFPGEPNWTDHIKKGEKNDN